MNEVFAEARTHILRNTVCRVASIETAAPTPAARTKAARLIECPAQRIGLVRTYGVEFPFSYKQPLSLSPTQNI